MSSLLKLFCCLVFLSVARSDAHVMQCYRENEILDCVFSCPPQPTCRNRGILFNCLESEEPCRPQCACKTGYYRNSIGECVNEEECERCSGKNEYYSCGPACDNVCSELKEQNQTNCPILNIKCNEQCYCDPNYARDGYGNCIPINECPEDGVKEKRHAHHGDYHSHDVQEMECGLNEEYTDCKKSCPPETCFSLVAKFKCDSEEKCTPGCKCKPMFLRKSANAPCTPLKDCPELKNSPDFN